MRIMFRADSINSVGGSENYVEGEEGGEGPAPPPSPKTRSFLSFISGIALGGAAVGGLLTYDRFEKQQEQITVETLTRLGNQYYLQMNQLFKQTRNHKLVLSNKKIEASGDVVTPTLSMLADVEIGERKYKAVVELFDKTRNGGYRSVILTGPGQEKITIVTTNLYPLVTYTDENGNTVSNEKLQNDNRNHSIYENLLRPWLSEIYKELSKQ